MNALVVTIGVVRAAAIASVIASVTNAVLNVDQSLLQQFTRLWIALPRDRPLLLVFGTCRESGSML